MPAPFVLQSYSSVVPNAFAARRLKTAPHFKHRPNAQTFRQILPVYLNPDRLKVLFHCLRPLAVRPKTHPQTVSGKACRPPSSFLVYTIPAGRQEETAKFRAILCQRKGRQKPCRAIPQPTSPPAPQAFGCGQRNIFAVPARPYPIRTPSWNAQTKKRHHVKINRHDAIFYA